MAALASIKQLCMLAAAGGIGAGSTVAVQKVAPRSKPAISRVTTAAIPSRPQVRRAVHRVAKARGPLMAAAFHEAASELPIDCVPTISQGTHLASFTPNGGGGDGGDTGGSSSAGGGTGGGYNGSVGGGSNMPNFGGFAPGGGGGGGGTTGNGKGITAIVPPAPITIATVVPEPRSWALMASGVGVLGLAMRTRRARDDGAEAMA